MKPTFLAQRATSIPKLFAFGVIGCAAAMVGGCTFTYAHESVPPTSPSPLASLPVVLPTTPATTPPPSTTTTTTTPTTTSQPTTTTTAAPAPETTAAAATTTTAAQTTPTVAAKPPYSYDARAIDLPLELNDALVDRVKEIGWEVNDRQDGAFKGAPELAYFADTPNPEASKWVTIKTDSNARGVCDAFGIDSDDPCEDVGIIYKGRWTLHTEKLNTGVRVANNVSEKYGVDVMHSATWGNDLIPSIDESLVLPEMNTKEVWYVGGGLITTADAIGAPAAILQLQKPRSSTIDLTISTLGVNMPLTPYRLDLDSDATIESVKVNGNDALLTNSDGNIKLVWNTDTGLKFVNSFKDERAEAFLRSLIDS